MKTPLRVLLLTQFFQPEPMFKGLPLARALMARGHEVEVLTGYPNYPGGRLYHGFERQTICKEVMNGVVVNRLPLYPSHDRSGVRRIATYLSFGAMASFIGPQLVRKPDVIWVYNLVTLAPAWNLLRAWHGAPVVLDVQDLWPESVLNSGMLRSARLVGKAMQLACALAYRSADRIVAQSPGFRNHLMRLGVPGARIEVIYNWTDEVAGGLSESDRIATRTKLNFDDRFNILFAGTIGNMQALDCVVEAASLLREQHPEVLFTLLGAGMDVDRLKAKAKGVSNLQFLPRCTAKEAAGAAHAADALLVHLKDDPMFSITIPSKTQSYLRSGRPVLIGVRGDAAELVEKSQAGYCFEPENAGSLVSVVEKLLMLSHSEREQMGRRGQHFYERNLSFNHGVDSLENELYKAVRYSGRCSAPTC